MPKIIALAAFAAVSLLADAPGSLLTQGMQLVYEADGKEGPPWVITSAKDTLIGAVTSCRVITLTRPSRPLETRTWCTRGDTLFTWDSTVKALRPLRPVGEGMRVVTQSPRGWQRYTTRAAQEQTISGIQLNVVQTVVTTDDSTGKLVGRLREFYAPGLATATSGVFEVPDSTVQGRWRMQSSFKLVRIVR